MKNFNEGYDTLVENYGLHITRSRFPRKLKLSEKFVKAFKEEFKKQTAPVYTENDDGEQIETKSRSRHQVLKEFQKALPFLAR